MVVLNVNVVFDATVVAFAPLFNKITCWPAFNPVTVPEMLTGGEVEVESEQAVMSERIVATTISRRIERIRGFFIGDAIS
jgi:hypothetical protein